MQAYGKSFARVEDLAAPCGSGKHRAGLRDGEQMNRSAPASSQEGVIKLTY